MARVCDNCGAAVAADARFCASCGCPLEPAAAQRKFATMVFADLVDSTGIATGSDPEQLRGRLAPFFEVARGALEEHGGTIEKFIGDAVLAVFGVPRAHGDDPDRAVAAALALVQRLGELDDALSVRVGIEAGEVLSTGGDGDLSVTGEAVNAAARLQQAAQPGETLVGQRAAQACRLAQLQPLAPIEARGMPAPLPVWLAVEATVEPEGAPRLPLLGRDDDLELLRLVYRRAAREGAPQLVVITGEAGIGKSRLAGELIRELRAQDEPPRVLSGHNPPYGRGIAFWALGEILRDAACASADDPVEAVGAGLERVLSGLGAEDAGEMAAALVVVLSGSNGDGEANVEDVVKRAWKRFVALLTADRPLVLAIDDAHWADDGLLDLLEEAAFGLPEARLVILCTARPELFERRPDFGRAARNVTQVELRPLEASTTEDLVRLLMHGDDEGFAQKVAEASGGNPFFAEEVARCMPIAASQGPMELPDTVQAAIAARMDLLPGTEKRTLQYASVLGEAFLEERLEDLLGDSPREQLDGLERKALIQEHLAKGGGRYVFRHQLIRDVAYSALPRGERADLHERAAADIGSKAGERLVELAEIVAFHLAQAAELGPAPARSEAAHEAALGAARIADRRGAPARAQELYEQAAALALDDADRAEALRTAGETAIYRWRGDHGLRLLRESAEVAERAGLTGFAAAAYARAVEAIARMGGVTGDLPEPEIHELLERAKRLVADDDVATCAQLLLDDAWIAWRFNRPDEIGEPARRGLELARATDDVRLQSSALDAVSADEWYRQRYESCLDHARQRVELLEHAPRSPGLEIERQDALHMLVESSLQTGAFAEAAEHAAQARDRDLRHGVVYSAWCRTILPWFFLGRWDESLEAAGKFREAWLAEERPPLSAMASAAAAAGAIHGYRGDEGQAKASFELADSMAGDGGGQTGGIRLLQADVALHHGQPDVAVERVKDPRGGFWWNTVFLATRAEALVAAGRDEAEAALAEAEKQVGQQPYARAIALRARGRHTGSHELIEQARALFAELACPYQEARSAWMLEGSERDRALGVFREMGAAPPAGA